MDYSAQNIRNIALLGHGGNGKTTLAESMLFKAGGSLRLGSVVDGNTVSDYDPEEAKRQISISTSVVPVEYNGCKINVLDAPGAFDFAGEVMEALHAADAAIIVCSAKSGMSVGAEKAWKYCVERKPASSTSPRPTRRTPTTTPPSPLCGSVSARTSPPWWPPSGTRARRSSASSTCSTSAPISWALRVSGWRSTSPPTSRRCWTSSTTP